MVAAVVHRTESEHALIVLERRIRILERYEQRGLKIVGLKLMVASRELAEAHYAVHRERPFFAGLVDFITSLDRLRLSGGLARLLGASRDPSTWPGWASNPRSPM